MQTNYGCPFCGWSKYGVNPQAAGHYASEHKTNWQVVCNKCRARGPLMKNPQDAERTWIGTHQYKDLVNNANK